MEKKRQNETEIITKRTFAITFKDTYETTTSRPLAEKTFRACGLFLLYPSNVDFSKVVSGFDDDAHPPPRSPLANGPNTPTYLPAPIAYSTKQSPLPTSSGPGRETPTPLPAPIAYSTPQSPLPTPSGPGSETPTPLPAPIAYSTQLSPLPTSCGPGSETPTPLPAPIAYSTPQSPLPTSSRPGSETPTPIAHCTPQLLPGTAESVPNPVRPTHLTAGPSGFSSQDFDNRPQTRQNCLNTSKKHFEKVCNDLLTNRRWYSEFVHVLHKVGRGI